MRPLKDIDIRERLIEDLSLQYNDASTTKIVNEMGILHGRSRIDVAVINGIIHGYEIKSESDTLQRLPRQINDYNKVFDRMTIVIQRKFLTEIRKIVPKWWGIILVTRNKGTIKLNQIRKGGVNPYIDPMALSHLLWKEEAFLILKERGLHKGFRSKPRKALYERICDFLTVEEIKSSVNQQLKAREGWKCLEPLMSNDDLFLQ